MALYWQALGLALGFGGRKSSSSPGPSTSGSTFEQRVSNAYEPTNNIARYIREQAFGPQNLAASGGVNRPTNPAFILGRAGDRAMFSDQAVDDLATISAETNYFTETGLRRPTDGDPFSMRRYLVGLGEFRRNNPTGEAGFKTEAEKTLEQLRFQRQMNATGGVRGGRSRNPFTFATAPGVSQNTVARQTAPSMGPGGSGAPSDSRRYALL